MAFKTVLTVTGPGLGDSDLKLVASLCQEIEAHLSVLVVTLAAPPPIGEYAAMASDVWLEQRHADLDDLEKRTAAVSGFLAASPLSTRQRSRRHVAKFFSRSKIARTARAASRST